MKKLIPQPNSMTTSGRFIREVQRPGFHFTIPSYTLDYNFHYVDWNFAFDELIARPLGLRLGMHGTALISFLINCEDVMKRSLKVFAPGKHPITDTELLVIQHPIYGELHLQKIATQILDDQGQKNAWALSLNILKANDLDKLFSDLMARLEKEALLGSFGALFDHMFIHHPDFRVFLELVTQTAKGQTPLILGGTSPELVSSLYQFGRGGEILVVEPNDQLLQILRNRISKAPAGNRLWEPPTIQMSKGYFDRTEDLPSRSFDSVVGFELPSRLTSLEAQLRELHRLLTPGGNIVLPFFNPQAKGELIDQILKGLPAFHPSRENARNILDSFVQYFDRLKAINPTPESHTLIEWLGKSGFQISSIKQDLFGGLLCLIDAKKPSE